MPAFEQKQLKDEGMVRIDSLDPPVDPTRRKYRSRTMAAPAPPTPSVDSLGSSSGSGSGSSGFVFSNEAPAPSSSSSSSGSSSSGGSSQWDTPGFRPDNATKQTDSTAAGKTWTFW
jgi:hypothetical protein